MDIDDILASVDRDNFASPESTAIDHQQLTRLWVTERSVSEVLPWPGPLMERMMERVQKQIEIIEDLTASTYDTSSSSATMNRASKSGNNMNTNRNLNLNLKLSILQTDLSRTQYLIRSILRQRLSKLTKHAMHYLILISPPNKNKNSQSSQENKDTKSNQTPEDTLPNPTKADVSIEPSPLSRQEATFLYSHQHLLASHFGSSFLNTFPPQLRRLDDNAGGTSMVQGPDMKEVVFVRCLAEEVRIVIPADDILPEEVLGMTMRRGELWVTRWEGIKRAWERGDVEVL